MLPVTGLDLGPLFCDCRLCKAAAARMQLAGELRHERGGQWAGKGQPLGQVRGHGHSPSPALPFFPLRVFFPSQLELPGWYPLALSATTAASQSGPVCPGKVTEGFWP